MADIIMYGLSVAAVGLLTVFAALIILIVLIKVMEKIVLGATASSKASEPEKKTAASAPIVIQTTEVGGDEIVAVITAAIAAMLDAEGNDSKGFVVRSIRRVGSGAPAWNRAGREEQVYSRM